MNNDCFSSSIEADMEFLLPWTTAKANISGSQRHVMLTNLKPASSYEFRVSAVNGVGEGNPSAPTEVIHLPPERKYIYVYIYMLQLV